MRRSLGFDFGVWGVDSLACDVSLKSNSVDFLFGVLEELVHFFIFLDHDLVLLVGS